MNYHSLISETHDICPFTSDTHGLSPVGVSDADVSHSIALYHLDARRVNSDGKSAP